MGLEIQIQRWDGRKLWPSFQKRHPKITDEVCKEILFNITPEFNSLPDDFPKNEDLREVLQCLLSSNESFCRKFYAPHTNTEVSLKILYAIVNSHRLGAAITNGEKKAFFENQPDNEEYEIRHRLRWGFFVMPQHRDDLSKIGIFLEDKIRRAIQLIDKFLAMDDEESQVGNYFGTQETIKRTLRPTGEGENDDLLSISIPAKKSVRFEV